MLSLKWFLNPLLLFLYFTVYAAAIDTITASSSLKDGDILISAGQVFALGFFSPNKDSSNRYVGIWYHNFTEKIPVWVANQNTPVNGSSGILAINSDGNLAIYQSNILVWSSNITVPTPNNKAVAKLMGSGNLVLLHDNQPLWQGFDYPTDTKLPLMKTGINHRTGLTWSQTSWRSSNDPAPGNFSYKIEPRSRQFFIYRGSDPIWRAGSWTGKRWSGNPNYVYSYVVSNTYINNENETSVSYEATVRMRLILSESGLLESHTWSDQDSQWIKNWWIPKDQCDNYGHCGPNSNCNPYNADQWECTCLPGFEPKSTQQWFFLGDGSGGCVRKTAVSTCRSGEGFVKVEHAKVPDTSTTIIDMSLDLKACGSKCLQNCSCLAYATAHSENGQGCLMWYDNLIDTRVFSNMGQDLYVRVDAVELARYEKNSYHGKKLAAILVSSIVGIILMAISAYCLDKKRKGRRNKHLPSIFANNFEDSMLDEAKRNIELTLFDLSTIVKATDSFSPNNKLGEGGFGPVYKGVLSDGRTIAIKRLSKTSGQGTDEFKNEISLLAKLQHRNLVKIHGYCIDGEEKMLIYEFLANKSLDTFIFDETNRSSLNWSMILEIVQGIARGISYLHHDSRLRIIHRDLKASNILLDAEMNPKVSDFGLARIFGGDQAAARTNRVVGTYGYMSPEYAMEGRFSIKSDVYSFGILLLEILTSRKNIVYYSDRPLSNLVGHVWELWKEGKDLEIIDSNLKKSCPANEASRCIQIGLLCVQDEVMDRPNMSKVVSMLLSSDLPLPSPKQPGFIIRNDHGDTTSSASEGPLSVNEVTVSMLLAR